MAGPAGDAVEGLRRGRWHDLLADATGVPRVELVSSAGRLGDRAELAAGFRDEYYGLAGVTAEAGIGTGVEPGSGAPLVTAGVIDWARSQWGRRPTRFAKRTWAAPVVDLARLEAEGTAAARRWRVRTQGPKVLVATQTRVVEAAVDEGGGWVPSVPVIAVVPHRPADLWPLAAALASPATTAWLLRRAPGAALSRSALKIAARDLAELPLPADAGAWDAATEAFRSLAGGADTDPEAFEAFVAAAAAAYRSPDALVAWWRARNPTGPVGDGSG